MESELTECGQCTILESSLVSISLETQPNETPGTDTQTEEAKEKKKGKKKVNKVALDNTPIPRKLRSYDGKEKIDYQNTKESEEIEDAKVNEPEEIMDNIMTHIMTLKDYEKEDDKEKETTQKEPERNEEKGKGDKDSSSESDSDDDLISDTESESDGQKKERKRRTLHEQIAKKVEKMVTPAKEKVAELIDLSGDDEEEINRVVADLNETLSSINPVTVRQKKLLEYVRQTLKRADLPD